MNKPLIWSLILASVVSVTSATAQAVSPSVVAVSSTANVFQIIDDARGENGDADLLFIRSAVARNEAAIEAAKTILKTSFDADIRMLAGDSLKAHDAELRTLKTWLNLHGPKDVAMPAGTPSPTAPAAPTPVATPPKALPSVTAKVEPPRLPSVSPSLPTVQPKPVGASDEVTVTLPRTPSTTAPLPGANIDMKPIEKPTMDLLDIPPVPVSLTPVTR